MAFRERKGVHDGFWILCLLPAGKPLALFIRFLKVNFRPVVVLCVIMYARRVMLSVDIEELENLKYDYKGA